MSDESRRIEAIIHARNVGPEEQAKFNKRLSLAEIKEVIANGSAGRHLLMAKRVCLDENVIVEYKKIP